MVLFSLTSQLDKNKEKGSGLKDRSSPLIVAIGQNLNKLEKQIGTVILGAATYL